MCDACLIAGSAGHGPPHTGRRRACGCGTHSVCSCAGRPAGQFKEGCTATGVAAVARAIFMRIAVP